MRLALYQPDIPHNTGSLIRLAACLGLGLDLIGPFGFLLDDRRLRRVAMDYLDRAELRIWTSWEAFCDNSPRETPARATDQQNSRRRLVAVEAEIGLPYTDIAYDPADVLVFGPETGNLPPPVLADAPIAVHIPMRAGNRSLNLATAAAMVAGEGLRQCAPPTPATSAP